MSAGRRGQGAEGGKRNRSEGGFTLLEVVVAIALVGLGLAAALELLAVGLRSAKASGDYTQAVLLARQKLGELSLQELAPRVLDGVFGETYRWTAEVAPGDGETEDLRVRLVTVRVKVSWIGRGGEKDVELVTLRGVAAGTLRSDGGRAALAAGSAFPGATRGVVR